mgnify:CR=1 FL=1
MKLAAGATITGEGTINLIPPARFVAAGNAVAWGAVTLTAPALAGAGKRHMAFAETTTNYTGWTFDGTVFDGVGAEFSHVGRAFGDGTTATKGTGITGVQLTNTEHTNYVGAYALAVAGGDGAVLDGVNVHDNGTDVNEGEGIKILHGATNTVVKNAHSHNNTRDGIDVYNSVGTIVEDSEFDHNGSNGIEAKWATTDSFTTGGHIFRRNHVHHNTTGIHATGHGNTVEDNDVHDHTSDGSLSFGIRVGSAVDNTAVPSVGSVIRGNTVYANTGTGIILGNATDSCEITGNTATGNGVNIATNGSTVDAVITGNVATPASPANSANELRIGGIGNAVSGNTGTVTAI